MNSEIQKLRDTFAASALAGLLAQGDDGSFSEESYARAAYRWADAMLRERGKNGDVWIVLQNVNEDPSQSPVRFEFQGVFDSRDKALAACRTDRYHMGRCRMNEEAPHETTTDWLRDASYPLWDGESATSPIANHDAVPAAKASKCGGTSHDAVGTGDSLSRSEIDALQHVVEDGRIVNMSDYGHLRSLLVRLRPEWEDEDQEPERTRGVRHTQSECTKQGEGSVPHSRTESEPVAWAVVYPNDEVAAIAFKRQDADERATASDRIVPLYRHPQPVVAENATATLTDTEREAVEQAIDSVSGMEPAEPWTADTLRGLLDRTK